jgi:tRNA threonylcarbamoyladenosine biosynthesis protein TsaB
MRILALETSTDWCSVAVGDGVRWWRRDERAGQAQSERLLPMIDAALARWAGRCAISTAWRGPGSFAGIRIGCGVVQGLAFGGGLPVVPVPTLAAIAGAFAHGGRVLA